MDIIELLYNLKQNKEFENNERIRFLGHCFSFYDKSNSQNFQDVWALYESNFRKDGFYVEFGATDGFIGSNSLLLRDLYSWKGILAEPNPVWHQELDLNRKDDNTKIVHECVFTQTGKILDFLAVKDADLSTIQGFGIEDEHTQKRKDNNVISVSTISLYDLLENNNAPDFIDYISVDTEGSEYDILSAFFTENSKFKVKSFTIEHNFNQDFRNKIFNLMSRNGYIRKFTEFSRWDDFYTKENLQ